MCFPSSSLTSLDVVSPGNPWMVWSTSEHLVSAVIAAVLFPTRFLQLINTAN